jgi:hypothetical protein
MKAVHGLYNQSIESAMVNEACCIEEATSANELAGDYMNRQSDADGMTQVY